MHSVYLMTINANTTNLSFTACARAAPLGFLFPSAAVTSPLVTNMLSSFSSQASGVPQLVRVLARLPMTVRGVSLSHSPTLPVGLGS